MGTYTYYGLDMDRNEIATGTVAADSVDAAIRAAESELAERDTECADIDVIETASGREAYEYAARYQVTDAPANGTAGQDCGEYAYQDLPTRLRAAIDADPDAGEWILPALSDGDSGDELPDLQVIVTVA